MKLKALKIEMASSDIYDQAEATLNALRQGKITPEEARVVSSLLKVKVKQVEVELDHAKLTGRLQQGSAALPGFSRAPASLAQAKPGNGLSKARV